MGEENRVFGGKALLCSLAKIQMNLFSSAGKQAVSLSFMHSALFTLILPDPYNPVMRNVRQMRLREVKGGLSHTGDGVSLRAQTTV